MLVEIDCVGIQILWQEPHTEHSLGNIWVRLTGKLNGFCFKPDARSASSAIYAPVGQTGKHARQVLQASGEKRCNSISFANLPEELE
jgi:hypothetical protein